MPDQSKACPASLLSSVYTLFGTTEVQREEPWGACLGSAKTPYALGLSDLGAITAEQLPIKALAVKGVLPTPDHVRSGHYPLVKTLSFVFRPDKLPKEAWAFLDFVRSPEAAQLLTTHGYLPGD